MSIENCSRCGNQVDTDFDSECYVEVGNMRAQTKEVCMCRKCRDAAIDEAARAPSEPPGFDEARQ